MNQTNQTNQMNLGQSEPNEPAQLSAPGKINFSFSEAQLRAKVSQKTYQRAQEYVMQFTHQTIQGNEISGKVEGNYGTYTTFLHVSDKGDFLEGRCSCRAADQDFCKHSAALGLTYLATPESFVQKEKAGKAGKVAREEIKSLDDVAAYLKRVTLDELVKELKARGTSQKSLLEILKMNPNLFSSAKRCEQRGRYYNFLNALKLACLYLLKMEK